MGLFFDPKPPSDEDVDVLAGAYRQQPPAANDLDREVGRYVRLLGGANVNAVTTALQRKELGEAARTHARAALSHPAAKPPTQFHPWRFTIALLIFLALLGGGVGADVEHLAASSAALFGFAGSVFGVVTAFLGAEK